MAKSGILVRPVVTEKSEQSSKKGTYVFVVDRKSNKLEIAKAVEEMFSVSVTDVNTIVIPGKAKSRSTKTGTVRGIRPAYKKAYITLAAGEVINLYGEEGTTDEA
ncbi:MAG: ribosomal protein [Bacteroidota bacterium]|jgi:large subunit ribosomal protein L23